VIRPLLFAFMASTIEFTTTAKCATLGTQCPLPSQASSSPVHSRRLPYPGLNSVAVGSSVNIGGCIPTDYLSGAMGNASTSAIVGCLVQPGGSYTGLPTWPDAAVAGFVVTSSSGAKSAISVYGASGASAGGSALYGGNFSVVNCRLWAPGCAPRGGLDFSVMYGLEVDVNSYSRPDSAAPVGAAKGFIAHLNGDAAPSTSAQAYDLAATGGARWESGYTTEAGATSVGLFLNSDGPSDAPGPSQSLQLVARGAGGVPTTAVIRAITGGAITLSRPLVLPSYTVASLPTCNTKLKGGMAYVTDAAAPTYNSVLTGGGSIAVPVFCSGVGWSSH